MKNIKFLSVTIIMMLLLMNNNHVISQTIFETFDTYTVGDNVSEVSPYLLPWDGDPSVDTKVTDEEAFSGSNSIRVYNSGEEYYTDLIFQIYQGEAYGEGIYEFSAKMMIKEGSKAFFRLDSDIGGGREHYTLLCEHGTCMMENSEGYGLDGDEKNRKVYFGFPYNEDEWFDLKLTSYLGTSTYNVDVKVNEVCYGQVSFSEEFKPIISYNIWAIDGVDFYLDDLKFTQINSEYIPEGHFEFLNVNNRIYGIEGENFTINGGLLFIESISSYTLELNNNGEIQEYEFDQPLEDTRTDYFCIQPNFQFDKDLNTTLSLSKIDGQPIQNNTNVCGTENQLIYSEIPDDRRRSVFVEGITDNKAGSRIQIEASLDLIQERFPNNVSLVSVHNSDEDPLPTYEIEGLSTFTGLFLIDKIRVPLFDPNLEKLVLEKINTPSDASLRNAAKLDGDVLDIMTKVTSFADIPSGWKLEYLLIQDNYKGEGEAFDLVNGYGEGQDLNNPSCEYKYAPEIIPASDAIYDRIPLVYQKDLEIDPIGNNEEIIYSTQLIKEGIEENIENLKIISLLIDEEGIVENSKTTKLSEALEIDLSTNTNEVSVFENLVLKRIGSDRIEVELTDSEILSIEIYNIQGALVASADNIKASGYQCDISSLSQGIYLITLQSDRGVHSQKFMK